MDLMLPHSYVQRYMYINCGHIKHLTGISQHIIQNLIRGASYREPFCPQMGPYQTLRAENWWTQLLVRFRVFFISKNPEMT